MRLHRPHWGADLTIRSTAFISSLALPPYSSGQDPQEELEQILSPKLSVLRAPEPDVLDVCSNHSSPHRGMSYCSWNLSGVKEPVPIPSHQRFRVQRRHSRYQELSPTGPAILLTLGLVSMHALSIPEWPGLSNLLCCCLFICLFIFHK